MQDHTRQVGGLRRSSSTSSSGSSNSSATMMCMDWDRYGGGMDYFCDVMDYNSNVVCGKEHWMSDGVLNDEVRIILSYLLNLT
jgi:hypothetical protein